LSNPRSLRFHILLYFISSTVVTFMLLGCYVTYSYYSELRRNLHNTLTLMAEDVVEHGLASRPAAELGSAFGVIESYHSAPFARLFSDLSFSYHDTLPPIESGASVVRRLKDGRYLCIRSSLDEISRKTLSLVLEIGLVFGGAALLFSLLFAFYLNRLLGPLRCLVRFCRDGSERHDLIGRCDGTSDINRLRDAIIDLLDAKHSLFRETAHEIKSPLAILRARLALYRHSSDYPKERFIQEGFADIETISGKLREMLFLKALDYEMRQNAEPVRMFDLCSRLQEAFRPILEKKRLHLEAQWNGEFTLTTRKDALERVMQALFENIFIHTRTGSRIRIDVNAGAKSLHIVNEAGNGEDDALFSSSIGTEIIKRSSDLLGYRYETFREGSSYHTRIVFEV